MRLVDADELITAFPCGETVRTESVRATIKHMPTIEERKTGKWERKSFYDSTPVCPECGIEVRWDYEYCPYCGTKLEGEEHG